MMLIASMHVDKEHIKIEILVLHALKDDHEALS